MTPSLPDMLLERLGVLTNTAVDEAFKGGKFSHTPVHDVFTG